MSEKVYTLLAVDDEPTSQLMIKQIFRKEVAAGRYQLIYAEDGVEALAKLAEHPVDLVLSDINMPNMDGIELIKNIYEKYPHLRVIMVSAYSDMVHVRQTLRFGPYDYLVKPIDPADLRATAWAALIQPPRGQNPDIQEPTP